MLNQVYKKLENELKNMNDDSDISNVRSLRYQVPYQLCQSEIHLERCSFKVNEDLSWIEEDKCYRVTVTIEYDDKSGRKKKAFELKFFDDNIQLSFLNLVFVD